MIKLLAVVITALIATATPSFTRDNGTHNPKWKQWFDALSSGKGGCCSYADGLSLDNVDWDFDGPDGTYRVRPLYQVAFRSEAGRLDKLCCGRTGLGCCTEGRCDHGAKHLRWGGSLAVLQLCEATRDSLFPTRCGWLREERMSNGVP